MNIDMINEIFVKQLMTVEEFFKAVNNVIKVRGKLTCKEYVYGLSNTNIWVPSIHRHTSTACNRIAKTMVPKVKRILEESCFDPKTTKVGFLAENGFDSILIIVGSKQYKFVLKDSLGYANIYINGNLKFRTISDRYMKGILQGLCELM